MLKLLIVVPLALLFTPLAAAQPVQRPQMVATAHAGNQKAREAWFRQCVADILEARVALPARQGVSR